MLQYATEKKHSSDSNFPKKLNNCLKNKNANANFPCTLKLNLSITFDDYSDQEPGKVTLQFQT